MFSSVNLNFCLTPFAETFPATKFKTDEVKDIQELSHEINIRKVKKQKRRTGIDMLLRQRIKPDWQVHTSN